jgi:hypothetical protein
MSQRMRNYKRSIRRLKAEIQRIDEYFYLTDEADPVERFGMLERKRDDIIRSIVLQMQTSIEDLLNELITITLLGSKPREKRRRTVAGEALDKLLEGSKSLGFFAKIQLAKSLRLISAVQADRLLKVNALRNKCAHHWLLKKTIRRKRKPRETKLPLLRYNNRDLHTMAGLEEFMGDASTLYLALWKKVYMTD